FGGASLPLASIASFFVCLLLFFLAIPALRGMKKLSLSLPFLCTSDAFAQSPTLLVRVYKMPNLPAAILLNAEREAGALLESCSIKVLWEDCSKTGVCDHDLASNELFFSIHPPFLNAGRAGHRSAVLGGAEIGPNGTGVCA